MINGARMVLDILRKEGITDIFGYPGGAVIPIYDALYDFKNLNHYFVRHEQGAAHAADAYARSTGKVGVCLSTSGPGATNLVTGIMTALMDSVPMVAITGNVVQGLIGKDAFQETDIIGITNPITKQNFMVRDIRELPQIMKRAFQIAASDRPGPVLVDVPRDIQLTEISVEEYEELYREPLQSLPKAHKERKCEIQEAIQLLNKAKRPIIIAGQGVLISNATNELLKLAQKGDIPVVNTLLGLSSISSETKYYLGMIGMHGSVYGNHALHEADVVLAVGMRFDDRVTGNPNTFIPNAKIIHVEIDGAEIGKNKDVDCTLQIDAKEALLQLAEGIEQKQHTVWFESIIEKKKAYPLHPTKADEGITASAVIQKASEFTKGNALVVTDVGQHQMWSAQYYDFKIPRSFLSSGGAGTMGYGIPGAVGAAVGNMDRTTLVICGDGGIQMTASELMVIAQYNLPVKILLIDNQYLGMVRQWQELFFEKRYSFVNLETSPDFENLAKAYHLPYSSIKDSDDFSKLQEALTCDGPMFIHAHVVKEENVYPMIPAGKSIHEMRIGGEL